MSPHLSLNRECRPFAPGSAEFSQSRHHSVPAASPTSLLTAMPALRKGFERARLRSEKHSNGTVFAARPPTFRRHPADIGLYYIYKRHVQNAAASERPPTKADKSRHWPIRAKPAPPAPVSPHPPARVPHWPAPSRAARTSHPSPPPPQQPPPHGPGKPPPPPAPSPSSRLGLIKRLRRPTKNQTRQQPTHITGNIHSLNDAGA